MVLYYSKYHYELNHIEHFWFDTKQYTRFCCEYSLNDFWKCVSLVLDNVSNSTCLVYYHYCLCKIDIIDKSSYIDQQIGTHVQFIISQPIPKKIVDIATHRCWSCYIMGQYEAIYDNTLPFMVSVFYFWLMYGWCVASLGLVPVAMPTLIFLGPLQNGQSYQANNSTTT